MRLIPQPLLSKISYILVFAYAIHLCWAPFANSLNAGLIAFLAIVQTIFGKEKDYSRLKSIDLYLFSIPVFFSIIGLFYSEDPESRIFIILLPIVLFTLGIGSYKPFTNKQFKNIGLALIISTALCAVFNVIHYNLTKTPDTDIREMSVTMSHIRFSLICVIGIATSAYYLWWDKKGSLSSFEKYSFGIGMTILLTYLLLQQSLSSIGIFILFAIFSFIQYLRHQLNKSKLITVGIIGSIPIIIVLFIFINEGRHFWNVDYTTIAETTVNGNKYSLDFNKTYYLNTESKNVENGTPIYQHICEEELKREWTKRSNLKLDSLDHKNEILFETLIRYLSSKGLQKDSLGLSKLSDKEIQHIENGFTNHRFTSIFNPSKRIYTFFWEIYGTATGDNPTGKSVSQRFFFQQATVELIKDYFWFGYGSARLENVLQPYYEKLNSPLKQEKRLGPHSQFFSFFAMYGLIGFLIIFGSLTVVVIRTKAFSCYFKSLYIIIVVCSMLFEDTLSTQAGVVLYGFFGALYLFGRENNSPFTSSSSSEG